MAQQPLKSFDRPLMKGSLSDSMLKRRKESGAYLAIDSRHRWSVQMMMKNYN